MGASLLPWTSALHVYKKGDRRRVLSFSGEFGTDGAFDRGSELVGVFLRSVEETADPVVYPFMVARFCTVARLFLEWAVERNYRARQDGAFNGNGDYIQVHLTTLQCGALQLMVADCGGKECITPSRQQLSFADLTTYELFNGGLLMRAVFRWRTC